MNNHSNLISDFDKKTKLKILTEISKQLLKIYVFNEKAKEIKRKLNEEFNNGIFDKIMDIQIFVDEINKIFQEITNDKHLKVIFDIPRLNKMIQLRDSSKEEKERIKQEQREFIRKTNFGFKKLEILDDNIGYLDLIGFGPCADASETAIAAMKFLAFTKSIIIDLRNNLGGEPEMVRFLASYFLKSGILWNTIIWPYKNFIEEFWTLDKVTGKRIIEKDLYILTSKDTFSGGEEFAYGMKWLKRATIIGETTKGGAHPTDAFSVLDLLILNIPNGRSVNPISKTNWEAVGVEPDIPINADLALKKAYELALKKKS